jgi:dTMP kinase
VTNTEALAEPPRENALVALVHIRVFRRLWAAITFSSLGDWLGLLANTALAQQLTHHQSLQTQGAAISGVILVRLAPDLLFGPFAAAFADKLDRRKIVIAGDVMAGVLYASIAAVYNLVWLYLAQFLIEAVGLFTQPAKQVIQSTVVPKKLLASANQLTLISVYGTVPVASAVFAVLSSVNRLFHGSAELGSNQTNVAIVIALLLNTVSFFVSSGTIFVSRRSIPARPASREREQSVFTLLREGVGFVRRHALIRGLYVGIIGAFAAGGLTVGVAQLWVATLSAGAAGYSIMFGSVFTGLAVGMLVGPRALPSITRGRVFGFAIGGAGGTLLVASLMRDFILADVLAAFIGLFAGVAWIVGYTMIGHEVEERLRGRIFAFVLSSVRLTLLATIAIGPNLAGLLGSHSIEIGENVYLQFSGPGLTLLAGGVVALLVSWYATSRATPTRIRLRDVIRRRLARSGIARGVDHAGLFVTVDGLDPVATAAYVELVCSAVRARQLSVATTAEPTQSATGRRVRELLDSGGSDRAVAPETIALLAAADRSEHVTSVIRPALDRGEVVVCDRFVLSSTVRHAGLGADLDRLRGLNDWSTGGLLPDVGLVLDDPSGDPELQQVLRDQADLDADRYVICPVPVPETLPSGVVERLSQLIDERTSLINAQPLPR